MGSNVIYLADVRTLSVPTYRRLRTLSPISAQAATGSGWTAAARKRAATHSTQAHAAEPGQDWPLRVTQLCGPEPSSDGGARLRISGRLIDVCTELERLAAAEAMAARRA